MLVTGAAMGYQTWRTGSDWAVLAHVHEDLRARRLIRDVITFREVGRGYRRGHERHYLAVVESRAVLAELRRAGFVARRSRRYGRLPLPVRRLAFIARKR